MEIKKINIKAKDIAWSDKVGQSFANAIKFEVERYNKAIDNLDDVLSKCVQYDSLEYHSNYELIESLRI